MATKILSIEVGNSVTRICEMDYKAKDPKVHKYFCIPTPVGVVEDGFVNDRPDFALSLKKALNENRVKTKQVVFVVTSSKLVTREVSVPAIKANQVGSYIKANANDYFPIDLASYELAHVVLGTEKGEDGKDKYRVLAIAAGKDLISGYAKLASDCGLRLMTLDYSGNSVYQIMKSECGDATKLVIKLEDNNAIATIISNHKMMLQRNIACGFDRAVQAYMDMSDSYEMNAADAFMQMTGRSWIKGVLSERTKMIEREDVYSDSEEEDEKRKKITATFTQLISNMTRVIELYNSKGAQEPITEIVLVGMGAEIAGLTKLLTNELRLQTKTVRNFTSASTFQTIDSVSMGRYVGVLGASFAPVAFSSENMKKKDAKKVPYSLLTTLVYVVFLVVVGVLLTKAYVPYMKAQDDEKRLKSLEVQYAQAEVVHKQYLSMKDFHQQVTEKHRRTLHSNDELVAFLTELEEKMPADLVVTSFYSDAESASFIMNVPNLEEAAVIFQTLREFESLQDVTAQLIAGNGESEGFYSFEVFCIYYPIPVSDTAEVAGTAE